MSLWAYAGAGLLAVCRAKYFFPHYAIFLVAPTAYAATIFGSGGITRAGLRMRWPGKPESWIAVAIVLVTLCTYMPYIVRYARMTEVFHKLSQSQLERHPGSLRINWPLADRGPWDRAVSFAVHWAAFSDQQFERPYSWCDHRD